MAAIQGGVYKRTPYRGGVYTRLIRHIDRKRWDVMAADLKAYVKGGGALVERGHIYREVYEATILEMIDQMRPRPFRSDDDEK
jgi:hypothetical protein